MLDGKQGGGLVPTVVLAEQHRLVFAQRFADRPVVIEGLTRTRTPGEAKAIRDGLAKGRVDIVVYATGTNIPDRSLKELTHETWELMIGTNLTGAFNCTSAVLPAMPEPKSGLIIYLSSGCVQSPDMSGVSYQATKQGLSGLAHGTFQEVREDGIRTTVIFPGLCDTPLVLKRPTPTPPEVMAKALKPEDVAEACLFVASLPSRTRVPELVLLPSGL